MYSHYMSGSFTPLKHEQPKGSKKQESKQVAGGLFSDLSGTLKGLTKHLSLQELDTGDVLLLLIILFLFLEGDNLELVITLGLLFLLGLSDDQDGS